MATRDKRLAKIRRNPRTVRFAQMRVVLEDFGFVARRGNGDHVVFSHPLLADVLPIPEKRPYILAPYVKDALALIDRLLA